MSQQRIPLKVVELLLLRLGLLSTAILSWNAATLLWEAGNPGHDIVSVVLPLLCYITGFILLILAAIKPHTSVIPVALVIVLCAYLQFDRIQRFQRSVFTSTDVYMLSDYAATLVRLGHNPYQADYGEGFRIYQMGAQFDTPTLDGDFVAKYPYPALGFLIFIPFQLVGLSTELVYPIFFLLCMGVLYRGAPRLLRPVALIPFFIDPRYIYYALGGVSDYVWIFFICLCILNWRTNKDRSALWFGLACSFKQQPWLFAPFLMIRLWYETEGTLLERLLQVLRFVFINVGVFLLFNVPYIAWDFRSWLTGSLQPALDALITLGLGLSLLTTSNVVIISRSIYTSLMAVVFIVSLFVYIRHFRKIMPLLWILPAIALWMGHRSLTSYWYVNAIPLVLEIVRDTRGLLQAYLPNKLQPDLHRVSWRPTLIVVAGTIVFILGTVVYFAINNPKISVEVQKPIFISGGLVDRLTIKVTNASTRVLTPRISIQTRAIQPRFWDIERGPMSLQPNMTAYYTVRTKLPDEMFELTQGAQVIVSDSTNYELRTAVAINGDSTIVNSSAIANGNFNFWLTPSLVPFNWGLIVDPGNSGEANPINGNGTFENGVSLITTQA